MTRYLRLLCASLLLTLPSCQKPEEEDPKERDKTTPEAKFLNYQGEKIPLPAPPLDQELVPVNALIPPQVKKPFSLELKSVCKDVKKTKKAETLPEKRKESCLSFEKNEEGLVKLNSYLEGIEATGDSTHKALCLELYCNK